MRINKAKSQFFEKINKTEKVQIIQCWGNEDIIMNPTDARKIMRFMNNFMPGNFENIFEVVIILKILWKW